jgi:hypothetical protein
MPKFLDSNVVAFLAFVVPGFLSMQIFSQIRPRQKVSLKDNLLEAISFSLINFVLLFWAIDWALDPNNISQHPSIVYAVAIVVFLVMPAFWPLLLVAFQNFMARHNLFLATSPTAWDHFFKEREPCWVIVHLSEARRIGGRFGSNSYASAYPDPGHIYIEELWTLDERGGFVERVEQSHGIVLRPGDYQMIEFFSDR